VVRDRSVFGPPPGCEDFPIDTILRIVSSCQGNRFWLLMTYPFPASANVHGDYARSLEGSLLDEGIGGASAFVFKPLISRLSQKAPAGVFVCPLEVATQMAARTKCPRLHSGHTELLDGRGIRGQLSAPAWE
jgi:hypothetical protein